MVKVISRLLLITKLQKIIDCSISIEEVNKWADKLYPNNFEPDDWEGNNSLIVEILPILESADMNLLIAEDIPLLISVLKTPKGKYELGLDKLNNYFKQINYTHRKVKLNKIKFYQAFCK